MSNKRTNKVKSGMLYAIIIAFLIAIIGSTYAIYSARGTARGTTSIAKWHITLNGNTPLEQCQDFELELEDSEENENVVSGKLAPGKTLKATLEVDPTGSEVAVDYSLAIGSILPNGFDNGSSLEITRVTATLEGSNTEAELYDINGEYIYNETLADVLGGNGVSFKIYVRWEEQYTDAGDDADTANIGDFDQINVPITITARQHLEDDGFVVYSDTSKTLMAMSESLNDGDKFVLTEDITYDDYTEYPTSGYKKVNLPENSVLDLAGNTITVPNGALSYIGDDFTIENGNFVGLPSQYNGRYGIHLWNNSATPDVSTGVVIQNVATTGICLYNTEVTLKNVTVTMPDDAKYYTVYGNVYSKVTIESGTYTAGNMTTALIGYCGYDNTEVGVVTQDGRNPVDGFIINGGTFITNGKPFSLHTTNSNHIQPIVRGGIFDIDITANNNKAGVVLEDGYSIHQISENRWEVTKD